MNTTDNPGGSGGHDSPSGSSLHHSSSSPPALTAKASQGLLGCHCCLPTELSASKLPLESHSMATYRNCLFFLKYPTRCIPIHHPFFAYLSRFWLSVPLCLDCYLNVYRDATGRGTSSCSLENYTASLSIYTRVCVCVCVCWTRWGLGALTTVQLEIHI